MSELQGAVEALLVAAGDPVDFKELALALEITEMEVAGVLTELSNSYQQGGRGLSIRYVGEKVQLCTNPVYHGLIERLLQPAQSKKFSQSVLETLSIVAYKQPVTRSEIEAIRGVRCEYSVGQLLSLGFIEEVGRKDTIGRPVMLGTTEKFLMHFNLSSIDQLPHRAELLAMSPAES